MRTHLTGTHRPRAQAGFSMIEMLMTAFIMAIGILGLSMLLVMSLKASRGGRSLSTAVLVGEHVMDRVELEGRLSWLNITDTNSANPTLLDLPSLMYINLPDLGSRVDTFNSKGGPPTPTSADPAEQTPYFTVTTSRAAIAPALPGSTGALSDITVRVQFTDQLDQASLPIVRTVTLTRRITHG